MAPRRPRQASVTDDRVSDIEQAREAAEAASARYRAAILEAGKAGVPVRHIARAAGVTRQRIYVLLKSERERRTPARGPMK